MSLCSIVTCALTMKYYVEENVSQRSCTTIRHVVKMLGSISETLIFFFLGVVTITTEHEWNWGYILFTLLFAFVWRGLGKERAEGYLGSGGGQVLFESASVGFVEGLKVLCGVFEHYYHFFFLTTKVRVTRQ